MEAHRKRFPHHCVAEALRLRPDYHEALGIAQRFLVRGNVWLIGGQVYRTAASVLYDRPVVQSYDFDFLLECPNQQDLPSVPGWRRLRTGMGGIRLQRGTQQIDIVALADAVHPNDKMRLARMSTPDRVESYLGYVPLTVQSIVYNIDLEVVYGAIGTRALLEQTVALNNNENCSTYCARHGMTIPEFINRKAESLGFRAIH